MASCTISPGQEVTDIYSQCYYDQARADRAAKCAEYRSGVCTVQGAGCVVLSLQGVPCRFRCGCPACEGHWPLLHCLPGSLQDTPQSALMDNVPRYLLFVM